MTADEAAAWENGSAFSGSGTRSPCDSMGESLWVFGYGSLIWRPDFVFEERIAATLRGWVRRFWQASTDHRGIPEAPGRVVTLMRDPQSVCPGVAYRIGVENAEEVVARLDHRESGGYMRRVIPLEIRGGQMLDALVYLAGENNASFLGPAPLHEMAQQIFSAVGPSGANIDYLMRLEDALNELGQEDPHVTELVRAVAEL